MSSSLEKKQPTASLFVGCVREKSKVLCVTPGTIFIALNRLASLRGYYVAIFLIITVVIIMQITPLFPRDEDILYRDLIARVPGSE